MHFKIEKKENPNINKYQKTEIDIAYKFTEKTYKEFGDFIKSIVLFGSQSRKSEQKKSDIDILIVIDDTAIYLTNEVIQTYRVIVEKISAEISDRLHVTTLQFTHFWDYCRVGDPIAINMLRDGVPLLDIGFFEPLQILLKQGKIRPTPESVWTYLGRAGPTLYNAKWHILQGALDLYWAVIDAAHAALMEHGEIPPSPGVVAELMENKLVKTKLLDKRYVDIMRNFYRLSRMIIHREIREIKGEEYDRYINEATDFVDTMRKLVLRK